MTTGDKLLTVMSEHDSALKTAQNALSALLTSSSTGSLSDALAEVIDSAQALRDEVERWGLPGDDADLTKIFMRADSALKTMDAVLKKYT